MNNDRKAAIFCFFIPLVFIIIAVIIYFSTYSGSCECEVELCCVRNKNVCASKRELVVLRRDRCYCEEIIGDQRFGHCRDEDGEFHESARILFWIGASLYLFPCGTITVAVILALIVYLLYLANEFIVLPLRRFFCFVTEYWCGFRTDRIQAAPGNPGSPAAPSNQEVELAVM